jgi:hypothetical protein
MALGAKLLFKWVNEKEAMRIMGLMPWILVQIRFFYGIQKKTLVTPVPYIKFRQMVQMAQFEKIGPGEPKG